MSHAELLTPPPARKPREPSPYATLALTTLVDEIDAGCAYAVHENALEETLYAWDDASATALPTRNEIRRCGYGCFAHAGLDQIHRLGNSCAEPAISIHVYGVEREQVCTHVNRVVQIA